MSAGKKKGRLEFHQDADATKQVAEHQRRFCEELAAKFESNESLELERYEREWVAAALRFLVSDVISGELKGRQGPLPKFDPAAEALVYQLALAEGKLPADVIKEIVERVSASLPREEGISTEAVRKGMKPHHASAAAFLQTPGIKRRKVKSKNQ